MVARFLSTRPSGGSVRRRMAIATAGLGAAWVAGYLFVISRQGTELDTPMTVFLATFVGVMAALALGAAVIRDRSEGRSHRHCCTRGPEASCRRVFSGSRQLACR